MKSDIAAGPGMPPLTCRARRAGRGAPSCVLPPRSASLLPVPCSPVRAAAAPWARCVVPGTETSLRPISPSGTCGGQCWRNMSCGVEPLGALSPSPGAPWASAAQEPCQTLAGGGLWPWSGSFKPAFQGAATIHMSRAPVRASVSHQDVAQQFRGSRWASEGTRSVPLLSEHCHRAVTSSGMSRSWKMGWPGELTMLGAAPSVSWLPASPPGLCLYPSPSCCVGPRAFLPLACDTCDACGFASAHSPPGLEATGGQGPGPGLATTPPGRAPQVEGVV